MNRNRTDARIARFAIPLAMVAVLVAGCAARSTTTGAQATGGEAVPVTLADKGQVVALHVGQEIQVSLGAPDNGGAWTLATYPRSMLAITATDPRSGLFTLRARSKGQGLVGFTLLGRCGPPLVAAAPEGGVCPDAGGAKGLEPGMPVPATLVTYTIRVR
jgi:hypothetical protein